MLAKLKRLLSQHSQSKDYVKHNRVNAKAKKSSASRAPEVLFEFNDFASAHIAYSYLAAVLADVHDAQINAYLPNQAKGFRSLVKFRLKVLLNFGASAVYRSFGVNKFFRIKLSPLQKRRAHKTFLKVRESAESKEAIEDLNINGIWIGDLVYDSYLRRYSLPTIEPASKHFQDFLLESIEIFTFWSDYFDSHDVRAINVSHCVYNQAIPLRIGVHRGIDVFQVSAVHVYRLNKDNLFAYNDFFYFRDRFIVLPENVKKNGIELAKQRIQRRFSGEVGVDMSYSTKSAYGKLRHQRLLRETKRKKVLIATHCFFDSPHSYGKNLFPDFYEWLEFLGRVSVETDYDWYIKTHPDYLPGTKEIVDSFVTRFPKFCLLPADASHLQIVGEGVDVALTCYGTIGFEYAALGVPVINASLNNPHIAYNFNIHARTVDHYHKLLESLENIDLNINKNEVYEYYFMKKIFNTENLFFNNYELLIKKLGGYRKQFTPDAYHAWLSEWTLEKHIKISVALHDFIESGDFRMDYRHFGEDFTLEALEFR
jgi:hypothetical protein